MPHLHELLAMAGLPHWKPVATALLLPPAPFLFLALLGAALGWRRPRAGCVLVAVSVLALWLTACAGIGRWLSDAWLRPPAALSRDDLSALGVAVSSGSTVAIVVLGAGVEAHAPEYGQANLTRWSNERLRYGVWLSRQTGAPVAFSGGVGWAQQGDAGDEPAPLPEAVVAARLATQDYGRPLRWVESASRDTRENAVRTVALLRSAGVRQIVLVTHGWHMPRALALFREAAAGDLTVRPAPMGLARRVDDARVDWVPTADGFVHVRLVLRELVARALGG